jgi:hypothetical protein
VRLFLDLVARWTLALHVAEDERHERPGDDDDGKKPRQRFHEYLTLLRLEPVTPFAPPKGPDRIIGVGRRIRRRGADAAAGLTFD